MFCEIAEPDAGPNAEERGQQYVPMRFSLARSPSSVSFAFDHSITTMTLDQFWTLIAKVKEASGADVEKRCELLDAELRKLSLVEVRAFDAHFTECLDRAYTWELWAAAYIIGGGCSDDGFWDFRSTLISMGRDIFEGALADPETLADVTIEDDHWEREGFQYVADTVALDLSGGQDFPRSRPHPKDPAGESWEESKVAELYPGLAKRYDYTG